MTDAGTSFASKGSSLPVVCRPKRSFRWTGYAGLALCAALVALTLFGVLSSNEGVPERMRTPTGVWIFLLSVQAGFGAFVLLRLNLAHGSLRMSDTHIELRTPLGLRRIAWSKVGRVEFRSAAGGAQSAAGFAGGLAFGAVLGMATGIHVGWHRRSGVGYPRVFLAPSSTRRRLSPMG